MTDETNPHGVALATCDLAKAFAEAGTALGTALLEQVQRESTEVFAKVGLALQAGERLQLSLEICDEPCIRLSTIDDYQQTKRVMTLSGAVPPAVRQ